MVVVLNLVFWEYAEAGVIQIRLGERFYCPVVMVVCDANGKKMSFGKETFRELKNSGNTNFMKSICDVVLNYWLFGLSK